MELFYNEIDGSKNLLPKDGIVNYYGKLFIIERQIVTSTVY